jgi:NAD-dependent deacetylase
MSRRSIFLLTGAGVSAESGLGTFREKDGLWSRFSIEDVASIEGYRRDPQRVLDFYNLRRANLAAAKPNAAHAALARLEKAWNSTEGAFTLCTQNVDDLHEQAGSRAVIHMHGELTKTRCDDCGNVRIETHALSLEAKCAACGATGWLRPHIVWFGEIPLEMERIESALEKTDLFVSIGTSGSVYPAAGFVDAARAAGAETMEINLEPSDNASMFSAARYGKASEAVPAWVQSMIDAL